MVDLHATISEADKALTIHVGPVLDLSVAGEFEKSYLDITEPYDKVVIDMGETIEVDSAGLGLLVVMKKALKDKVKRFSISNCNEHVFIVLEIANFEQFFHISKS